VIYSGKHGVYVYSPTGLSAVFIISWAGPSSSGKLIIVIAKVAHDRTVGRHQGREAIRRADEVVGKILYHRSSIADYCEGSGSKLPL